MWWRWMPVSGLKNEKTRLYFYTGGSGFAATLFYLPACLPQADPSRKDGRRRTWIADRPLPHDDFEKRLSGDHVYSLEKAGA